MDALEAIYRDEEKWTDVIDVKMQRADGARASPARSHRGARSVAALWREQVRRAGRRATPRTRRSSRSIRRTTRRSPSSRSSTRPRAAGSRSSSSTSRASRRARRRADKTELLRKIARVFEEKLDDKSQALDALVNALGDGLPRPRDGAIPRAHGAGDRAAGARSSRRVNGWLKQQTEPREKIRLCLHLAKWYGDDLGHPEYAQPYYAQIIQLDPNNVGAMRQMASSIQEGRQLAADGRDADARPRRGRRTTSTARRS